MSAILRRACTPGSRKEKRTIKMSPVSQECTCISVDACTIVHVSVPAPDISQDLAHAVFVQFPSQDAGLLLVNERVANALLIGAASFVVWTASEALHQHFLPFTRFAPGVDYIYVPSGIRLILLLVGGVSSAVGIALGNLLSVGSEFGVRGPIHAVAASVYLAFATLFSLWVTLRVIGIDRNLKALAPRHMPWICFGTAVGSSVLHSAFFYALHPLPMREVAKATLGMIAGDFIGCLIVVYLLWMLIRLFRWMF